MKKPRTHGAAGGPQSVAELAPLIATARPPGETLIIGVTGSVAVGKTTFAAELAAAFQRTVGDVAAEIVCTDGFLLPNAVLEERNLAARKGFPESFDTGALRSALTRVRAGAAAFPAYSHVTYDIEPDLERWLQSPAVLIVEGLSLDFGRPRARELRLLDCLIYIDADEANIEAWYITRFLDLCDRARTDPSSFYARFNALGLEETAALARRVWCEINLPNLRDHICRARSSADIVVRKDADHAIGSILVRAPFASAAR